MRSNNRVEKLEKEITAQKRHYIWSESSFVRTLVPFHSNVRVGYNGNEVDGKGVLDLMTLTPPEGTNVRIRIEGPEAAEAMRPCTINSNERESNYRRGLLRIDS